MSTDEETVVKHPSTNLKDEVQKIVRISVPKLQFDECLWARHDPQLQRACYFARVCQYKEPLKCHYNETVSIIQNGPTCGLTALSMLLRGQVSTEELLEKAKQRKYTNNGEMFSAKYLFELTCDYITPNIDETCLLHVGQLDCSIIKDHLATNSFLLVPYDPDQNHAPCRRSGHCAHWALITGYMITAENEFYVFARHGKSRHLAAWSLKDLSESNSNLFEFCQPDKYPDHEFILPPGGIQGAMGLNQRSIIVNRKWQH